MDIATLQTKLQTALDTHKGSLPPKTYFLDITDGPTLMLDGRQAKVVEVVEVKNSDCTISASKADLETLLMTPEKAPMMVFRKKIKISNLAALLPLLKVLQAAFEA